MRTLFLDIECYPNYFLILFKDESGNEESFVLDENNTLPKGRIRKILMENETVGFNSRFYDIPLIIHALKGVDNSVLKRISDKIIDKEISTYDLFCEHRIWTPHNYNHVDIKNVIIGQSSLKMYGARINTKFIQDLPYDPSKFLTEEEKEVVKKYCSNDLDITKDLYVHLNKEIGIRKVINEQYNVDVRSKSDAQIAEVLINKALSYKGAMAKKFDFKYSPPLYLEFEEGSQLNELLNYFKSKQFKGERGDKLLKDDNDKITIGEMTYRYGIGGLHSTEENRTIVVGDNEYLIDVDVVSYYPSIILNNEYCPSQFDKDEFIDFYRDIYNERIKAKRDADKAKSDTYKIILNGSFGKFGDKYSRLYSPELLINTTVTGQLTLLMLIEELESLTDRVNVVSANTDGIVIKLPKALYQNVCNIIEAWEECTNLKTEETFYKSLHSQSVNSYIAITNNEQVKTKGMYAHSDISRNPAIGVCKDAIINYLTKGIKIEETINKCKDKNLFLMVRKVKDGGYYEGEYLGKVVRWYWGKNGLEINNKKGDRVALSEGAVPFMDLTRRMVDVDVDKYVNKSNKFLAELGVEYGRD